jgi:hypothetical protein
VPGPNHGGRKVSERRFRRATGSDEKAERQAREIPAAGRTQSGPTSQNALPNGATASNSKIYSKQ